MVINHLDKLFVTSDAATIIRELEVVHPAGKVLVMASQQQEHEVRYFVGGSGMKGWLELKRWRQGAWRSRRCWISAGQPPIEHAADPMWTCLQMGDRTNLVMILAGEIGRAHV